MRNMPIILPGNKIISLQESAMERIAGEFDKARGKLADDLKMIVTDSEDLLRAAGNSSEKGLSAVQVNLASRMAGAKARISDLSKPVTTTARQANDYVHRSPWTVIGTVAAIGILIGYLSSRR